jgi:uncharacterized protein YjbI with pentapeptide repeats
MAPVKDDSNFQLPRITQAELNEIIRKHQNFLTARPNGARAVVRDKDLSRLSFIGQNLSQSDFTGCIMAHADLTNASFESATLFGCDFTNARLTNTRLARADMRGAAIGGADLSKADMTGADLREGKTIIKRKMKKKGDEYAKEAEAGIVHFTGSDLTGAILNGAMAISADFTDSVLLNASMQGTKLMGANMKGADLSNVNLGGADMRNADFSYATMTGAQMEDAEKSGTNFNLVLTGETVGQAVTEIPLTLDELIIQHTRWVATSGRQGKQMTLTEVDMRRGPKLAAMRLTAIRANKCTFAEMDMRSIELQGANLDDSDFRKVKLQSADLRGSRFRGAICHRTEFSRANMNPLILKKPDGITYHIPCRLEGAQLRHAVFNGTRMMHARFNNCDLTGADFTNCDLRGAVFTGADLTEAKFKDSVLEDATFDDGKFPEQKQEEDFEVEGV